MPKSEVHCCLPQVNLNNKASGLYRRKMSMFICIQSRGGVRADHKWPLGTHVEMHVNAR